MEFCPRCGTRLIYQSRSRVSLCCPKCGYKSELHEGEFSKGMSSVERPPSIAVVDRDTLNLKTISTVRAYCEKCGENKAETWTMAAGSEGISTIIFYRCVSCGHTWREIG